MSHCHVAVPSAALCTGDFLLRQANGQIDDGEWDNRGWSEKRKKENGKTRLAWISHVFSFIYEMLKAN